MVPTPIHGLGPSTPLSTSPTTVRPRRSRSALTCSRADTASALPRSVQQRARQRIEASAVRPLADRLRQPVHVQQLDRPLALRRRWQLLRPRRRLRLRLPRAAATARRGLCASRGLRALRKRRLQRHRVVVVRVLLRSHFPCPRGPLNRFLLRAGCSGASTRKRATSACSSWTAPARLHRRQQSGARRTARPTVP